MKTFYYIMVSIRQLNPNENPRLLGCLSPFFFRAIIIWFKLKIPKK